VLRPDAGSASLWRASAKNPLGRRGAGHRGMVEGIDGLLLQDRTGGADRLCEIILLSEHSYNRLRTNTKIP